MNRQPRAKAREMAGLDACALLDHFPFELRNEALNSSLMFSRESKESSSERNGAVQLTGDHMYDLKLTFDATRIREVDSAVGHISGFHRKGRSRLELGFEAT